MSGGVGIMAGPWLLVYTSCDVVPPTSTVDHVEAPVWCTDVHVCTSLHISVVLGVLHEVLLHRPDMSHAIEQRLQEVQEEALQV